MKSENVKILSPEIFEKKILICCGSGGVGKTTTAAALGLAAADRGKKVIVLTIDPARRLATALGLDSLGSAPVKIDIHPKANAGRSPSEESASAHGASDGGRGGRAVSPPTAKSGTLFAMMLDTKRTFDRLIESYTKDPKKREAIFKNKLYQHMSNMIAGSQEYMAMEKIHELFQKDKYDLMILDTPPTRHALDFLDAPKKMMHITGNSLLDWFLKPGIFSGRTGRFGMGLMKKGADKIMSVFDNVAGLSFLSELSEMLILLRDMLGGFQERAEAVSELLRQSFVGFLLVTSPSPAAIRDVLFFHEKIREADLNFLGFVMNRIHPEVESGSLSPLSAPLKKKAEKLLKDYAKLAARDLKSLEILKKKGGKKAAYATVPLFQKDVHDLDGLKKMSEELLSAHPT